jgi:hypothetical protein
MGTHAIPRMEVPATLLSAGGAAAVRLDQWLSSVGQWPPHVVLSGSVASPSSIGSQMSVASGATVVEQTGHRSDLVH